MVTARETSALEASGSSTKRPGRNSPNPVGRPVGRNSDDTRVAILDVAEALFAEGGYEGTSIRDIAQRANVQAAVIGYHFGTKAEVFDAVVERRASILNEIRQRLLDEVKATRRGKPVPIEALIRSYALPFLEMTNHGEPGWRNFATLMGRLANSPRGTEVIAKHSDGIATIYLNEFRRTLPTMPDDQLVDAFLYMVSAMLFVCADTGRWERLVRKPRPTHRDAAAVMKNLLPFVAGGFKAFINGSV